MSRMSVDLEHLAPPRPLSSGTAARERSIFRENEHLLQGLEAVFLLGFLMYYIWAVQPVDRSYSWEAFAFFMHEPGGDRSRENSMTCGGERRPSASIRRNSRNGKVKKHPICIARSCAVSFLPPPRMLEWPPIVRQNRPTCRRTPRSENVVRAGSPSKLRVTESPGRNSPRRLYPGRVGLTARK